MKKVLLLLFLTLMSQSCWYSFTGGRPPADLKTVSVSQFQYTASYLAPTFPQLFTEKLRDRFQNQSSLKLLGDKGDVQVSGTITDFNIQPISIQGNEQAGQNRLKVTVQVQIKSDLHPELNSDKPYSNFADFSSTTAFSSVESQLLTEVSEKITLDIYNGTFSNW